MRFRNDRELTKKSSESLLLTIQTPKMLLKMEVKYVKMYLPVSRSVGSMDNQQFIANVFGKICSTSCAHGGENGNLAAK